MSTVTYIWNGGGYPLDADDSASILHAVALRNGASQVIDDTVTSVTIDKLFLNPGSDLSIQSGLLLNLQGLSVWSGGTLRTSSTGGGTLGQRGTTAITGPTTLQVATVENTNEIDLTNSTTLNMTAGSVIINLSGESPDPSIANIEFKSDADIMFASGGSGQAARIENFGVLRKSEGTGRSEVNVRVDHKGGASNNMAGTIEVLTGTLALTRGASASTGAHFNIAANAVLEFGGTVDHDLGQTTGPVPIYTGSGAGHVRLVSGAAIVGNPAGISGVGASPRAIFDFDPNLFEWEGGTIGGGPIRNDGHIKLTGTANMDLSGQIINDGHMIHSGAGTLRLTNEAVVNDLGATYEFQGDGNIGNIQNGFFTNNGTVRKSSGTLNTIGVRMDNHGGTIEVLQGQLVRGAGSRDNGGHFNVAAGAVLEFGGSATHNLGQTSGPIPVYTAAGGGHVRLIAGATISGNPSGTSGAGNSTRTIFDFDPNVFEWQGGTISGGPIRNDGNIKLTGAVNMDLSGQIINEGHIVHTGAGNLRLQDEALVNDVSGLYDFQGDGGIANIQNGVFTNRGTLRKSTGTGTSYVNRRVNQVGTVEALSGTLRIDNIDQITGTTLTGGTYRVGSGATLQIDDDSDITTNQATVVLSGIGSMLAKIAPLANNQGTFEINSGRNFSTIGNLSNSGLVRIGATSTLTVNGTYTQTSTGKLKGKGKLIAPTLTNGGTVSPGDSPGVLEVQGNYVQSETGRLEMEIGGAAAGNEHDQLIVTGSAMLAGALDLILVNSGSGFQLPNIGDDFAIVTATGGVSGSFQNASSLHSIAGGSLVSWSITPNANDLVLEAISITPLADGDYNGNGVVDGADYVVWRRSAGGINLAADGNRDGLINDLDYEFWRTRFGNSAPASGAIAAVPEPAALLLFILEICSIGCPRRRRAC